MARFRYSGDGKRTCRALSKKLFAFLRAYADSTDIYEATCTNRRVREGEGLLEGNPGGREWRYVHCVSSWNKQDVSANLSRRCWPSFLVSKEYSDGDWNEWTSASCPPPPFPRMFLIIARETMTREIKIAHHGNTVVVESDRSRRDSFDDDDDDVPPIRRKDGDGSIKLSPLEIIQTGSYFGRVIILRIVTNIFSPFNSSLWIIFEYRIDFL